MSTAIHSQQHLSASLQLTHTHHQQRHIHAQRSLLTSTTYFLFACLLLLCTLPHYTLGSESRYYDILGIKSDATDSAIKKSFRKLSLKYHPDKNGGDEVAAQKYLEVNEAYEVLSNEEKRQTYDLYGEEGLKQDAQRAQRGGGGGLFDMFGFGGGQQQGRRRGPDFRMDFKVTLEELYNGSTKQISIKRRVLCKSCRGTGAKGGETKQCHHCGGKGQVMSVQQLAPGFNVQMAQPCHHCGGTGKTAATICPICSGQKLQMEEKTLDAIIERGMQDGNELRFERASEQSPDTIPGDVILTIRQDSHPTYRRDNYDLHTTKTISLRDALLGFQTTVKQLDDRDIVIKQTAITPPEHIKIIKGEGMPHHETPSVRGDMYVKFTVDFPKKLSDEQKELVKQLLEKNGKSEL